MKTRLEPKSVRDIQVFISFVDFYQRFIKGFTKIAALLTSMLKTITPSPPTDPANSDVVGGEGKNAKNLSKAKNIKKLTKSKKLNFTKANFSTPDFFIFEAQTAFIHLQKAFIKALILY